jgi:hypothetical protein
MDAIVKMIRRIGALLAALALAAVVVSPALATGIKASQVPTTAANAPQGTTAECSGFTEEGMVLWHFVLNDQGDVPAGGWGTVTLTASFDTDGDGIADATRVATDSDPVDSYIYQFEVTTPEDWVLTDASTDFGSADATLLLSHVCFGSPPPEVPEAPLALLLPLGAMLALGGYLLKHRREATVGA